MRGRIKIRAVFGDIRLRTFLIVSGPFLYVFRNRDVAYGAPCQRRLDGLIHDIVNVARDP